MRYYSALLIFIFGLVIHPASGVSQHLFSSADIRKPEAQIIGLEDCNGDFSQVLCSENMVVLIEDLVEANQNDPNVIPVETGLSFFEGSFYFFQRRIAINPINGWEQDIISFAEYCSDTMYFPSRQIVCQNVENSGWNCVEIIPSGMQLPGLTLDDFDREILWENGDPVPTPCPDPDFDPCYPCATLSCIDSSQIDPNMQCLQLYDPVCGCNGVTFANACIAQYRYGVTEFTPGACEEDDCFDPEKVSEDPCPFIYDPVCGCDGITYPNACTAMNNGIKHVSPGPCQEDCQDPANGFDPIQCIQLYDPVCGCNGISYPNACYALADGVTDYIDGPCPDLECDSLLQVPLPHQDPVVIEDECGMQPIDPVCGCDSSTYDNACYAFAAGVAYYTPGPCEDQPCKSGYMPDPPLDCEGLEADPVCGCDTINYLNPCDALHHGVLDWTPGLCPKPPCIDTSLIDLNMQCPAIYAPVCGCDGKTYPNACTARYKYGLTSFTMGECESSDCIDSTKISLLPCTFEYDPVCGCDGVTYPNKCMADRSGVIHTTPGPCFQECVSPEVVIDAGDCPHVYDPVCGCNGVSYANVCFANADGIIHVVPGPCPDLECDSLIVSPLPVLDAQVIEDLCSLQPEEPVCGCDGKTYPNPCYAYAEGVEYVIPGVCEDLPCKNPVVPLVVIDCSQEPVEVICGCNDSTYINPCAAIMDGVNIWEPGPCQMTHVIDPGIAGSIHVYPNPATGILTILPLHTSCPYEILGISGNRVQAGMTSGSLDVRSLPEGIYLLRIWQEQTIQTIRWVKQ